MEQQDFSVWFEAREQSKFLLQTVDVVFRVDLRGKALPSAVVEFRGNFGGSNSAPIPLEKLEELSQVIALFAQNKTLLGAQAQWDHQLLKADLGPIQANCVYHKKAMVIIQHHGGTIERELNTDLTKEIREFTERVRTKLTMVGKK